MMKEVKFVAEWKFKLLLALIEKHNKNNIDMNMLNLGCEIMQHEFYDEREEKSYYYIGRWLSHEKTCYETLVGFLRANKIKFIYCQLDGFCHRYGLKVYPESVEEANKLFYSPWRSKLFGLDRNFRTKV